MAKLYVGKNNAIPVRNAVSMHGDDIVDILNNEDLSNVLDGKVDKVSTPSILYGTDSNGQQTTYDLSLLFDTETAPDGYTDVEYITSGDESTKSVRIRDYHAETSSFMGFEIVDAGKFMDYFNSILARRYDYPITCVKFQVENPSTSGVPMLWYIYVNAQGGTEPTMRNGGSVYEEPYGGLDGIEQRWGIRPIYSDTTSREEGDSGTFDIYEVSASGQYIDTGIDITKYNIGAVLYNEEHSTCVDPTATHTSTPDSTDWYLFKGKMNNATTTYGEEITQFRFKITNVASTLFSVEIYANDKEVVYETYTDTTTDSFRGQYGVILSGNMTVGDEYVFYLVGRIQDTYAVETSIKLSDYQISQTHNDIFGSISQSGNFGCGLRCSENDGILFKHYVPNVQSGFAVPYNKGNWNNIKVEPGLFTLNGESYSLDSGDIRTVSGKTFILFGISNENGISVSGMSMKRTKIYKNGNLVFNGIPCVEDSSGIAGMYDLVTQQFFKSAKEGAEFIAGPVKESSSETNLGIEGENVLVGLNKEGKISGYTGKNGVIIEGTIGIDDYEELEYIESGDGTLAFDTKRHWGESEYNINSAKWEITYNQVQTSAVGSGTQCQYVFGDGMFADMGQSFNRIDFRFFRGSGSFPYTSNNGNTGAGADDGIFLESLNTWNTFAFDYKKLYLNNVVIKELDSQISSTVHSKNFHIFNAPNAITSGEFGDGFIGKISKVTLIVNRGVNDNVTMANFVPVRRKSDNELGFYDTVNGTFCPNIGEGIPIAGPAKTGTISLEKSLDCFLENIAIQKDTSLMITTPTLPSSSTAKNLGGTGNLVIGPYGEITSSSAVDSIAINGQVTGSGTIVIGKNSSTSAGYSVVVGNEVEVDGSSSVVVGRGGTSSTSFTVGSYSVILGNEIQTAKRSGVVAIGYHVYAYNGDNLVAIGNGAASYGNLSVSIGNNAQSLTSYCIAIGGNARVGGTGGIAIGNTSSSSDEYRTFANTSAIAIGSNARAESNSVAIGNITKANGSSSVNIGTQSTIPYSSTVVIGYGATASGGDCGVGIGVNSQTSSGGIAVGYNTKSYGNNSVAIGFDAYVNGNQGVAIGYNAKDTTGYNVAIGREAQASDNNAVAIGSGAKSTGGGGIAIGESAKAGNRSTAIGGMCSATGSASITIGHASSTVNASEATAIGLYAKASNMHAVSLGYKAETGATGAIQLGEGTNNSQNTLQFMNYPLVDSDGIMPYERLSEDSPTDGYVLSYDEDNDCLSWVENGSGGGSYELPIASETTLGGVKIGEGLQINPNTGVLSVTSGQGGEGEGIWGQIEGNIEDQTDLMNILNSKFEQVQTIPTASNRYNNKVLQYIGISDLLYKHGYVYECQYRKVSQITGYTSDESRFNVTFDARRFEEYCKTYADFDPSEGNYVCDFDEGDNNWHLAKNGYEFFQISKNNLQYCGIYVDYSGSNEPQTDDAVYMNYIKSTNVNAPFGYLWDQLNVQPGGNVVDNVTSTSTTDVLSANQGRVLQEQIDMLSSIGQFLAIWDCDTGTARYLDDGYQYTAGNYFIVGTKGTVDDTRSGNWSSEEITSTDNLEVVLDDITLFENKCDKVNRSVTFTILSSNGIKCSYDNVTYTKMEVYNTFGIEISSKSGATYTPGDQVIITYTAPVVSYIPVGSEYDPVTGHETSTDDIEVSDMYFYDGENWILLANHERQIVVDHDLSTSSTNPVENRTVTNALDNKVSKTSEANRVYGTTSLGEQIALTLGEDLQINEGELSTTIDLSTKQDTLVSGENIKTINGESILGSGNVIIQGGSGEGIGTLNVANAFITSADIICDENGPYNYKGGYSHIMVTTNGDKDYLLDHMHDFYITTLRRKKLNGVRKFRSLNDHRIPTNIYLYCWRVPTYKYWDYDLRVFSEYPLDQRTSDQMSDADYVYFYTLSDFSSVEDLISSNPAVLVSDLRHDGETKTQEENVTQGNWGTCLNLMNNIGRKDSTLDVSYFINSYNSDIERCARYDIDKIVNLTNYDLDESIRYYDDTEVFKKMRGRLYKNTNGDKVYLWSNGWEKTNNPVFACLDDNDEPIVNYVPLDKRDISQWCTYNQFIAMGWELVEKRVDLDWFYFDYDLGYTPYDVLLNVRRISTTTWGMDGTSFYYLLDNPIQPVSLAECKIYMKELPYVYVESAGEHPYLQYHQRAYTWYEIKDNPDLMYMLDKQKEIIFVLPHDTYTFWMRTFRWERYVYHHAEQSGIWEGDEEIAFNAPTVEQISRDDGTYYYEWDGGYETQALVAHPTERHNLKAGLETTYKRRDRNFKNNYSPDVFWGGFTNDLANRLGDKHKKFNWNMKDNNSMWLPIAFSVATGHEVGMDCIGKETPVERTMTINGYGIQGLI